MAVLTFTRTGTKAVTPAKLDKAVFAVIPENHELLKAAYVAYLANGRTSAAQSKTRGEISGGGRKPWKQKGTGRARFGSSRNPIWRGGGIVFGPTGNENYSHKMHVNAKRQAIRQALSLAAEDGKLLIIESLTFKDAKTSEAAKILNKIGATKNTLLVVADKSAELTRATGNISAIKVVQAQYVNVYDALNADNIVMTTEALKVITEWLGGSTKSTASKDIKS